MEGGRRRKILILVNFFTKEKTLALADGKSDWLTRHEDKLAVSPRSKFGQNEKSGRYPDSFRFVFSLANLSAGRSPSNRRKIRTRRRELWTTRFCLPFISLPHTLFFTWPVSRARSGRGNVEERKPYTLCQTSLLAFARQGWIDFTCYGMSETSFGFQKIRSIGKSIDKSRGLFKLNVIECIDTLYIFESSYSN